MIDLENILNTSLPFGRKLRNKNSIFLLSSRTHNLWILINFGGNSRKLWRLIILARSLYLGLDGSKMACMVWAPFWRNLVPNMLSSSWKWINQFGNWLYKESSFLRSLILLQHHEAATPHPLSVLSVILCAWIKCTCEVVVSHLVQ